MLRRDFPDVVPEQSILQSHLGGTYILVISLSLIHILILVAGQLLVEQIYSYTVPVSVFITVFGGIYFLYLLLRERKES